MDRVKADGRLTYGFDYQRLGKPALKNNRAALADVAWYTKFPIITSTAVLRGGSQEPALYVRRGFACKYGDVRPKVALFDVLKTVPITKLAEVISRSMLCNYES